MYPATEFRFSNIGPHLARSVPKAGIRLGQTWSPPAPNAMAEGTKIKMHRPAAKTATQGFTRIPMAIRRSHAKRVEAANMPPRDRRAVQHGAHVTRARKYQVGLALRIHSV